jgi:hypothetical protein
MKVSTKRRPPLRFCALVVLSLGLLFPAGAARATAPGTVVAWGCDSGDDYGQCDVPSGLTGVTAIAAGGYHSMALKDDGTVAAWGCGGGNDYGQCDVQSGLAGVTAISAGFADSLALKGDGTVVAWGCGGGLDFGQCNVPSGLSGVTAIAAGFLHSLALKGDGTVVAWGCGSLDFGQCNVPSGLVGATGISAGSAHSLALTQEGTVAAWGCGGGQDDGQCNVPRGLAGVTAIAAGVSRTAQGGFGSHSLALVGVEVTNVPPDCSTVTATPRALAQMRDKMALITLSGATDPDGDTLSYHLDGVTQDEYVTGVGDDTSPDAVLTAVGADSNQVLVRAEANPQFNGRVYRIAYTVSDGQGGTCSGTAGPSGTTTAKVGVPRKKGTPAIDNGDSTSWNSFTGAPIS